MTRPVETRMSPLGAKVGEGARFKRLRTGLWRALLLVAFVATATGTFAFPSPGDAISLLLNCFVTAAILFGADR